MSAIENGKKKRTILQLERLVKALWVVEVESGLL